MAISINVCKTPKKHKKKQIGGKLSVSNPYCSKILIEEYKHGDEAGSLNIIIQRDEFGEQKILTVKEDQ